MKEPTREPSLLMTVEAAADYAGMSQSRMYEMVTADKIKSLKIGKSRRIPRAAVKDYVNDLVAAQDGGDSA